MQSQLPAQAPQPGQPQAPIQSQKPGQQPGIQNQQRSQSQTGTQQAQNPPNNSVHNQSQSMDQVIATCLALGNQGEVILGKLASEKSKNADVREFAKMMVEEHESCLKDLDRVSPGVKQATAKVQDSSRSGNSSKTTAQTVSATKTASTQAQGGVDFNQLHHELAQQCLADSTAKLNGEDGEQFDKCYIGMQLAKHAAMHSQLTVFERHATGELKELISKGLDKTEKHMKHAEKVMDQLAQSDSSSKKSKQ
ncbi:MAG: DUF4142 domain-containing protein [Pirellulaceae bacterium]|nr:DUF4142 domain-containing protein [Pirellulaceae bacterium]